jgi:hypothetical protein
MSARDKFHEAVKIALQKDGWTITADPLFFRFGGVDVYIDLAAERIIAAERNGEAIAIESKAFWVHLQSQNFIQHWGNS